MDVLVSVECVVAHGVGLEAGSWHMGVEYSVLECEGEWLTLVQ